jgi:hypothetical protein
MDAEFAKWLATLGVGGVLAGLMFMFYRKDVKQYTELWKSATDQLMTVVKENTVSNTKLISLIEHQERNMVRKDDIITLIEKRLRDKDGNS